MSFSPSNASTTTSSIIYTPRGDSIAIRDLYLRDDPSDAVPWPGNTYVIQDKASGKAITTWAGQVYMRKPPSPSTAETAHWLCVEADGYFGFFNKSTNSYLSFHDGYHKKRLVSVPEFRKKELVLPRRHPGGGYQLLAPVGDNALEQVATLGDGETLVTRQHAGTVWEFIQVSE